MNIQDEFIGAVYSGNVTYAEELLGQGARIGQDEILHSAAQRGNVDMLTLLLKSGGMEFIDQFDVMSLTPLAWAAKEGHIPAMKLLLQAGANVNAVNPKQIGNTALREVVGEGNIEVIELLLGAGADPNIPGWMQMTAIDKAKSQWENGEISHGRKILDLLNSRQIQAEKILSQAKARKSGKR